MKKKSMLVCLMVVVCMSLGALSVCAIDQSAVAELLGKMSIMNGYPDGELHLDRGVSRAEFSKITIATSSYKKQVASGLRVSPFSDVTYKHWAAPYVKLAVSNGLIKGYPDSTFRPDQGVLLEEAVTVYLRLLGYTDEDFDYSWPYGQLSVAENIGLLDDISKTAGAALTRGDVMTLTYNLLSCLPKNSKAKYLDGIDYKMVEDVVLIATSREDSSVQAGSVATSGGTYKIDSTFNRGRLGMRGDLIVKNGDTVVSLIPYGDTFSSHVIYACLDNAVVTYDNGAMGQVAVNNNTTCYMGTKVSTYGALKSSIEMGDLLSVKKDDSGKVEYITVIAGNVTGPVVVYNDSWVHSLSVSEDITVMRDGTKCTVDDIKLYDVAYYSPDLNMVLAYSKKVTGIYESATPNKDQLTEVTISGVTYQVESVDAFRALSSSGGYSYGDTVTVLLGKNGTIAGVASGGALESSVVGFFQSAGVKEYENQVGDGYLNYYVQVIGIDGSSYQYAANKDYSDSKSLGQIVRVNLSGSLATVASITPRSISGTVDAETRTIGSYRVANNVKILDVIPGDGNHNGISATVFLQQLDGMYLNGNNVLYYGTNTAGEIDELIVKDASGTCYQYGLILKATNSGSGMSIHGSYEYDVAGTKNRINTTGSTYNVGTGQPAKILSINGKVYGMTALEKISATIKEVTNGYLVGSLGSEYPLSDKVVVYKKNTYDYTVMALSDLDPNTFNIAAYVDKSLDRGGKIRVVVAEAK